MTIQRRVFIPDTHAPYHDKRAFKILLDVIRDFKPHEVVYLGDFQDVYCLSQYDKDPIKNFNLLEEELEEGRELIDKIERTSRANSFVFIQGNHEQRIDRYIACYASKLGASVNVTEILQIPRYYRWFPYGQKGHYRFSNFIATHGSLAGQNPASAMVKKYGANVIFGHTHAIQEYHIRNIHGEDFAAYNCGWLGDMERGADYIKSHANWTQGFAIGYTIGGKTYIQLISIINGRAVFQGKLYGK